MPKIRASLVVEKSNQYIIEIWGDLAKNRVRALYLKKKCLYIAVLSSVISQEMGFHEKKLIAQINDFFKQEVVDRVRFLS